MGMLLMGLLTFVGIIAAVWMVSSAFADGGILGVIGLIAWVFFWMWVASKTCGDDKGGKKK